MLADRGVLYGVRVHPRKNHVQVQSSASSSWRDVRAPEDLSAAEIGALRPYQFHHLAFLRVSLNILFVYILVFIYLFLLDHSGSSASRERGH